MPQYAFSQHESGRCITSYMQHNIHIVLQLLQVDGKANQQCRVICFTFLVRSTRRLVERYILGNEVLTISDVEPTAGQVEVQLVEIQRIQRICFSALKTKDFLYFLKNLPGTWAKTFNDLVTRLHSRYATHRSSSLTLCFG